MVQPGSNGPVSRTPDFTGFSAEMKALLHYLADDRYSQVKRRIYKGVDDVKFAELAERHRLTTLIYKQLLQYPELAGTPLMARLKELSRKATIRSLNHLAELMSVCREFNHRKIDFIVMKGPQLSHFLYGDGSVRTSVDLDIFLKYGNDIEKAGEILRKLQYNGTDYPGKNKRLKKMFFRIGKHESHFLNACNGTCIDLHTKPAGNTLITRRLYRFLFENTEQYTMHGVSVPVPSRSDYFLFLCYHGAVHQFGSLHWLADICDFRRHAGLAETALLQRSVSLNLKRYLVITFKIMNRLCGLPVPDGFHPHSGRSGMTTRLTDMCINTMNREKGYGLTLNGRITKTVYKLMLAENFMSRIDILISIIARYLYRML